MSADDLRALAQVLEADIRQVLVAELAQAFLDALPRHHRYEKSLRRLIEWAGALDAAAITSKDIARWALRAGEEARDDARARHGIGAQETFVLATRAAYALGIETGTIRQNPASQVALPERPPSRRTALTSDQLSSLHLSLLAHSRDPDLDDLVFQLLRETACRRQGAIQLACDDLAPATRAVQLVEKYGKRRWIPVSSHLS